MLIEPEAFDLAELSDRGGVSQRTVRYYIQQGLLPSPETRGPGAHYTTEHLDRLRLIRRLQKEHLPLAEIRRRLEELGPEAIRSMVERGGEGPLGDARDYIRTVLSEGMPILSSRRVGEPAIPRTSRDPGSDWNDKPKVRTPLVRAQWDRITLGPDVELHVRRPLSREQNKQIERLIDAARHIFEEE